MTALRIALIRGDGIGVDVSDATMAIVDAAVARAGGTAIDREDIKAGAGYFAETGQDIEPGGEERAGKADAIFLGAIGLPAVRHADGTEISPHLRLRDRFGLYAGARPVKAYPNAPKRPMTAFMLFSNASRAKVKEENPGITFGELVSLVDVCIVHSSLNHRLLTNYAFNVSTGKENGGAFQSTLS